MGSFTDTVYLSAEAIRTPTANKIHPLGTRGTDGSNRVYRYARNGVVALAVGLPVTTAALYEQALTTAMAANIGTTGAITTTASDIYINTSDLTAAAKDYYAEGYMVVQSDTGSGASGQVVRLKGNPQMSTSSTGIGTTGVFTFDDNDRLTVDIASGAVVTFHANPYQSVIVVAGGALTAGTLGVPNVAVSTNYYFWAQTWGPCPVLQDGTWLQGETLISSTQTDAGLQKRAVTVVPTTADTTLDYILESTDILKQISRPQIGWAMGSPGIDNYYGLVFLTISP
uniref:Tail protein n=1 Tax=viral metagenome TaxID=1070528 RepID=A0A6H1ZEN4_9ZZZZ